MRTRRELRRRRTLPIIAVQGLHKSALVEGIICITNTFQGFSVDPFDDEEWMDPELRSIHLHISAHIHTMSS